MLDTVQEPGRPDAGECLPYGLDAAAGERRAPTDWTLRSVRAIAYTMAGHELHHLASVRRQLGG